MGKDGSKSKGVSWEFIRLDLERLALARERAGEKASASSIRKFASDLPKKNLMK